jgi:hypothetical protein
MGQLRVMDKSFEGNATHAISCEHIPTNHWFQDGVLEVKIVVHYASHISLRSLHQRAFCGR